MFLYYIAKFHKIHYLFVKMSILNISNDLFTNLGLVVSDQCSHTIKAAVFADEDNTSFIDHREFGGSVFSRMENVFEYIMLNYIESYGTGIRQKKEHRSHGAPKFSYYKEMEISDFSIAASNPFHQTQFYTSATLHCCLLNNKYNYVANRKYCIYIFVFIHFHYFIRRIIIYPLSL